MGRLPGFDYKWPFFYMVTLKRAAGGKVAFCAISDDGRVVANDTTAAFERVIRGFHETWYCIEPIRYYVIMPDHLHLIIKMRDIEKRVSLAVVARQLLKALERSVAGAVAPEAQLQNLPPPVLQGSPFLQGSLREPLLPVPPPPVPVLQGSLREPPSPLFEHEWHDWIIKKEGQLAAFRKYILENPPRYALRRANRRFFTKARQIVFRGVRYWAYGNEALLDLPVIVAIKGHRRPLECCAGGATAKPGFAGHPPDFTAMPPPGFAAPPPGFAGFAGLAPQAGAAASAGAMMAAAARIGPGGAGLSTFLSPLEKEAGNAIIKAGGALIVLSMQGFGERWHPTEKQERLCAAGRMLYLSPYAPQAAKLDKREMHIRAHGLVDWALENSHCRLEAWP